MPTLPRLLLCGLLLPLTLVGQSGRDRAVELHAVTQDSPPQITLHWNTSPFTVDGQYVYRRLVGEESWVYQGNDPAPTATQWTDSNVDAGVRYEYKVYRQYDDSESTYHARGYALVGIDAPLVDQRGTVILLIDETQSAALAVEIDRFSRDLAGDGWTVITESAHPSDTPPFGKGKTADPLPRRSGQRESSDFAGAHPGPLLRRHQSRCSQ
ncbi:MAG: hypothetical protein JJT75_14590 [Opitutales bacterium]|nr:hypothetical protein [Opitutales bacterium]